MTKYNVMVWSAFNVDAASEEDAIEQAADCVREMKASDWDYEVEPVRLVGYETPEGNAVCVDCTGKLTERAAKELGYEKLLTSDKTCSICGEALEKSQG
jgi:hypothetical protein